MKIKREAVTYSILMLIVAIALCAWYLYSTSVFSPLVIELELEKDRYCIQDKIIVKASLVNRGNRPILVDGMWWLNPRKEPVQMSTGLLEILNPDGEVLPVSIRIEHKSVMEENFVILDPSQAIIRFITLNNQQDSNSFYRYDLTESGMYTIRIYYQNSISLMQQTNGIDAEAWTGSTMTAQRFYVAKEGCKPE